MCLELSIYKLYMGMYTHGLTCAVLYQYHCVCHWNLPLLLQLNAMEILFDHDGLKLVSKLKKELKRYLNTCADL